MTDIVTDQARRRVLKEKKVPADEKLFSVFEDHTRIIIKDRRQPIFGHKINLSVGKSSFVLDCVVEWDNPADSTRAVPMIERLQAKTGRFPDQACFDGGYASQSNLARLKELGVKDVAFSKKRSLKISEMVRSSWIYKKLRRFRAGVEGVISYLKRCFGLRRCTWKG